MRIPRPHPIVLVEIGVRPLQPCFVGMSAIFLHGLVDIDKHGTQEWRLRPRQVIGAVRIEHRAVVLDLEEKVIDHSASQFHAPRIQQSPNDEVAVPAVHFVEAPARHNIFVRKIEQTVRLNLCRINFAQTMNLDGQVLDSHVAVRGQLLHGSGLGKTSAGRYSTGATLIFGSTTLAQSVMERVSVSHAEEMYVRIGLSPCPLERSPAPERPDHPQTRKGARGKGQR